MRRQRTKVSVKDKDSPLFFAMGAQEMMKTQDGRAVWLQPSAFTIFSHPTVSSVRSLISLLDRLIIATQKALIRRLDTKVTKVLSSRPAIMTASRLPSMGISPSPRPEI